MKNSYFWAIIIVLLVIGGLVWYSKNSAATAPAGGVGVASYPYECDEHVAFTMTTSDDMKTISIAPTTAGAVYPPTVTLTQKAATSGVRYEGGGVVFTAHGETVTLGEGDSAINCSPVADPNNAPFNFGD